MSRAYEEFIQLSAKKPFWLKDGQKACTDMFPKEDIQIAKRNMKRCSAWFTKKMQIKITIRYYLIPIRMTSIKKTKNKCWWGCGEMGTLTYYWWEYKLVQSLWEIVWSFFKKLKIEVHMIQKFHYWVFNQTNENTNLKRYMHCYVIFFIRVAYD